jgi:transposase
VVKDIRRATRRHYSTEDKIRVVLSGLRGEDSIESPRLLRRLQTLRRWSHEQEIKSFFTRGPRTRCSLGARA